MRPELSKGVRLRRSCRTRMTSACQESAVTSCRRRGGWRALEGAAPHDRADVGVVRLLSVIDLRSDTVTQPTKQMRETMLAALVGDDVYAEDPTVNELEQRVAELFGHEAGLFCVSGSMCNMLGIRLLVEPGEEVVCDVQAHIARAEMGGHAAAHGLTMRT